MGTLQFIYLDVGGVGILDYSKTNKWNEMLSDLGVAENLRPQFAELFLKHEKQICIGENIDVFIKEAEAELKIQFSENYDMTLDFVTRFEKNPSMLDLIDKLRQDFHLGLLTAQYPHMLNMIFKQGLLPDSIWDVVIDSSVVGVTKPDPEIYELAETKAGVAPEAILFIDNRSDLLEIPKSRGWKTFEYDPAKPEKSTLELEEFIYQ